MADQSLDSPGAEARASLSTIGSASTVVIAERVGALGAEIAAARGYRAQAKAANTLRAYTSDWNQFESWCDERSLDPLPARPEAVATYLASLALGARPIPPLAAISPRSGGSTGRTGWSHRSSVMNAWSSPIRSPAFAAKQERAPVPARWRSLPASWRR